MGFVAAVWATVWLIGTLATGNGLTFVLTVSICGRLGYGSAWTFVTNFTHSHEWNHFLAEHDHDRNFKTLHTVMALLIGSKHRWNEMLFHDVHHAFPNAVGTLSQRGRFHGWEKVHDACVEVLHNGIWVDNGDEHTEMQKTQRNRSILMKSNKKAK